MKKYKPGQFVSIGGKLARVHEAKFVAGVTTCSVCANKNEYDNPCGIHASECMKKLSIYCYPKFIKQCGNQDK